MSLSYFIHLFNRLARAPGCRYFVQVPALASLVLLCLLVAPRVVRADARSQACKDSFGLSALADEAADALFTALAKLKLATDLNKISGSGVHAFPMTDAEYKKKENELITRITATKSMSEPEVREKIRQRIVDLQKVPALPKIDNRSTLEREREVMKKAKPVSVEEVVSKYREAMEILGRSRQTTAISAIAISTRRPVSEVIDLYNTFNKVEIGKRASVFLIEAVLEIGLSSNEVTAIYKDIRNQLSSEDMEESILDTTAGHLTLAAARSKRTASEAVVLYNRLYSVEPARKELARLTASVMESDRSIDRVLEQYREITDEVGYVHGGGLMTSALIHVNWGPKIVWDYITFLNANADPNIHLATVRFLVPTAIRAEVPIEEVFHTYTSILHENIVVQDSALLTSAAYRISSIHTLFYLEL